MTTEDDIILKLRHHISSTPKSVCPWASGMASTCIIKVCNDISPIVSLEIVKNIVWVKGTILIIAIPNCSLLNIRTIEYHINDGFKYLEAFSAHPHHYIETRRDPIPNVQVNSREELEAARMKLSLYRHRR